MSHIRKHLLFSAAASLLIATQAQAAAVSLSGTFTRDDEVRLLSFSTAATGLVTIETFGYAGGTDAAGMVVAPGGFDPVFALFSSDGILLGFGDDGATRTDPVTGAAFDALLAITLTAGNYVVAISQFDNFAIGPDDAAGFLEAGNATFTAAYGCAAGRFCGLDGADRNGGFNISVSGATVPEPTTLALVGLVLPCVWMSRRRKPAHSSAGSAGAAGIAEDRAIWRRSPLGDASGWRASPAFVKQA